MSRTVGAVLAGGRGRRMGGAGKATVELAGRPLLAHPLAALRAVTDEVAVVSKRHTTLPALDPEVHVWVEPDEPQHPLTGVCHALRCAGGRPVLVCAADMPLVHARVFARLLAVAPAGARAVVPRADGRLQPVCALYLPSALSALDGFDEDARATDVVQAIGIAVVEFGDGRTFLSVNTPDDLELAAAALRQP